VELVEAVSASAYEHVGFFGPAAGSPKAVVAERDLADRANEAAVAVGVGHAEKLQNRDRVVFVDCRYFCRLHVISPPLKSMSEAYSFRPPEPRVVTMRC
jgi:hypothetical protein